MSRSFHDQLWKELLAPCYQLKGNIFSREHTSTNRAPWQETVERLKFHFVVTKHLKEAVTGDLNDFFIHSGAEPCRILVFKGSQFCAHAPCIFRVFISATVGEPGGSPASMPKVRKWKCNLTEARRQRHALCGTVLSGEQIADDIAFNRIRHRKPPRDWASPERRGDNVVFSSIKTFTAELKDLLISAPITEDVGKYWPQTYFFRLES